MTQQERLSTLLARPYEVAQSDISMLEELAERFPYFEVVPMLLAKAAPSNTSVLSKAALYANGLALHRVLGQERPVVAPAVDPVEDAFVLESISSTDFFAFEENFSPEGLKEEQPVAAAMELSTLSVPNAEAEKEQPNSVSNYDDDTLPYTFLWWLAKTRKEHQAVFQPYAAPKATAPGELQQQYVEHIFHIQSPFNAEEVINNTPQSPHVDPKETAIIDNFLKKDPQISPPKPEQIDNENKAKKSAEDHNDLVSETLAKIYIEQMLYHKAIDTYQKLSLKFPEKSRYFADLIQSLEKKI